MKVNKIPLCEFKLMSVLLATQHLDTRSTSYMKTEKQILKTSIDNTATTWSNLLYLGVIRLLLTDNCSS